MDYQSTTPVDEKVIDVMTEVLKNHFGNPHSTSHTYGKKAMQIVEDGRCKIANTIGAKPNDLIFTSGATEANNLALKGVSEFYKGKKNHIIVSSIEHKCILQTCKAMEKNGFLITYLSPKKNGLIDLDDLSNAITDNTLMVSLFGVHNEIGVINDLESIGKITRSKGVFFHTDIAQGFGRIPIDVDKMNIDLASISAHKIYGPKGIGALYVRRQPKVKILPLFHGGGQERGLRSGTLPTFLIAGFGEAANIASRDFKKDQKHINELGNSFYNNVIRIPNVYLNGDLKNRYYGNWNFSFEFIEGESLMMAMKELAVSSGSACASETLQPSYVLKEIGTPDSLMHSSVRFGIGRHTTQEEINIALESINNAVNKLREMSPLWDMHKEGIDLNSIKWHSAH